MAVFIFYPVVTNYVFHSVFSPDLFLERVIGSGILIVAGCVFNKFRIGAILLASIPLTVLLLSYLLGGGPISLKIAAIMVGGLLIVLSGIHHHVRLYKIRRELELSLKDA